MSIWTLLGIPNEIGVTLFVVFLALSLAPYLGGLDLGILKIPKISSRQSSLFKLLGPTLLVATLICFLPIFPSQAPTRTACADEAFSIDFIVEDDIDASREVNQVRELTPLQEGLNICKLPKGVFGYEQPHLIDRILHEGWNGVCELSLSKSPPDVPWDDRLEIHKSSDGNVFVFAYVSESNLLSLQDQSRRQEIDFFLFNKPFKEHSRLIGIPLSRIKAWSDRDIEDNVTVIDATLC